MYTLSSRVNLGSTFSGKGEICRLRAGEIGSPAESGTLYFFIISDIHVRLFYRESKKSTQVERFFLPYLEELGLTPLSWKTAYTREDQSIFPLTSPGQLL